MSESTTEGTTEGTTSRPRKYTRRRESWGRVRKLPSGRYQASYVGPDELTHTAPMTYSEKGDAQAWLSGVRTDIERGKWKSPRQAAAEVFGPYARAWIAQRVNSAGEPLRERTRAEYLRYLERGLAVFENERLDKISPAQVRTWHSARLEVGKTTAAREARLLRAVLNTALTDGIVTANPVDSKLTRSATGMKYRPPTEGELAAMLALFERDAPDMRLALILAAFGGLRLSEWRALRRSDVTLDGERYAVSVTRQAQRARRTKTGEPWAAKGDGKWIVGPPKSAEGVRVVLLPVWATAAVSEHLAEHVGKFPESLLFPPVGNAEFMDDNRFYRVWDRAREELKIKGTVREHDLRAFAGTYYARAGATLRETMALLGHSTTRAAMAYQHAVGDRAAELADRMPAPSAAPPLPKSLDAAREARDA
ncbi:tyrosine-type recombinase/integrase [Leucobacter sp. W1478]|uniref:tyrosine-type recombinase/integrase n=1 Tax=Leucobacter sp. W1478 TaxID=3439065 RepID=UPI003F2BEFFE